MKNKKVFRKLGNSLIIQSLRMVIVLGVLVAILFGLYHFLSNKTYFVADITTDNINLKEGIIEQLSIDATRVIFFDPSESTFVSFYGGPVTINESSYQYNQQVVRFRLTPVSTYAKIELLPLDEGSMINSSIEPSETLDRFSPDPPRADSIEDSIYENRGIVLKHYDSLSINTSRLTSFSGALRVKLYGCEMDFSFEGEIKRVFE